MQVFISITFILYTDNKTINFNPSGIMSKITPTSQQKISFSCKVIFFVYFYKKKTNLRRGIQKIETLNFFMASGIKSENYHLLKSFMIKS